MLPKENNYDFRKRMLAVHEANLRNDALTANADETEITDGTYIVIAEDAGDVIVTAAMDFIHYLFTSMGVAAMLKRGNAPAGAIALTVSLAEDTGVDLLDAASYKGFRIDTTTDDIAVNAFDERGAAQALYHLEEVMTLRKAPFIPHGTVTRKPMFSPMMVHSGYGLDNYPDEHLSAIAHEGRDAILIFVKGVDQTPYGYLDFNELIYRAAKYGIDVYAYSYLKSDLSPEADNAEAYYDALYGKLFEKCPGLKGVTLVGESVGFPSHDPHVTPDHRSDVDADGLPMGKPRAGWWPCEDYPVWLDMVKKSIRRYKPDADIVFWTYNWGRQPKEARLKLIESLPTDISLQATFEMFEPYEVEGCHEVLADYSLKFEGPGYYFKTEAEVAAKRGIKLYAMTNTGGLTWDIGVIPYEPMPQQWMRRYEAMKKAHDDWGLCGIMESHHYGFYPSFISKLSKYVFSAWDEPMDKLLMQVLTSEFGADNAPEVCRALDLFSDAIRHYTPTDNDQYGAFRIGPGFPFSMLVPIKNIAAPYAVHGNGIYNSYYTNWFSHEVTFDKGAPISVKLAAEIRSLEVMLRSMREGVDILKALPNQNDKLLYLINLAEYIICSIVTGIHAKQWFKLLSRFNNAETNDEVLQILDEMEALLNREIENAEAAIPFAENDSRLGWEPSMEYMADAEHIRWKIKEVQYVIDTEIAAQRRAALGIREANPCWF